MILLFWRTSVISTSLIEFNSKWSYPDLFKIVNPIKIVTMINEKMINLFFKYKPPNYINLALSKQCINQCISVEFSNM